MPSSFPGADCAGEGGGRWAEDVGLQDAARMEPCDQELYFAFRDQDPYYFGQQSQRYELPCTNPHSAREMLREVREVELGDHRIDFRLANDATRVENVSEIVCPSERDAIRDAYRLLVVNRDLILWTIRRFQTCLSRSPTDCQVEQDRMSDVMRYWVNPDGFEIRVVASEDHPDVAASSQGGPSTGSPGGASIYTFNQANTGQRMPIAFNVTRNRVSSAVLPWAAEVYARAGESGASKRLGALAMLATVLLHELFHCMGLPDHPTCVPPICEGDRRDFRSLPDAVWDVREWPDTHRTPPGLSCSLIHMMSNGFLFRLSQRVSSLSGDGSCEVDPAEVPWGSGKSLPGQSFNRCRDWARSEYGPFGQRYMLRGTGCDRAPPSSLGGPDVGLPMVRTDGLL